MDGPENLPMTKMLSLLIICVQISRVSSLAGPVLQAFHSCFAAIR